MGWKGDLPPKRPAATLAGHFSFERRLLVDGASAAESTALTREVERLRSIYRSNRSFDGYSQRLLDAIEIKQALANRAALATHVPSLDGSPGEIPLMARDGHADRVARERPITFDLAAIWILGSADGRLPIDVRVLRHARPQFLCLMRAHFDEACPMGLRFAVNGRSGPALDLGYKAATAGLQVSLAGPGGAANLPDPAALNWTGISNLASCTAIAFVSAM